ncbi:helix-turn-helix transcriptional regulator [Paenibacillus sp. UMB4589-SE434]|uniref:helix-turn-helix domain-containing protein n=1 Tax=Paenibacillus sp. UMB4589-SE434 TaxID=3046314 RepID=UPI00254FF01B|nr:helix-turn-helix transcriptional regulator [Paenibacillus sp. UMB4589-SE434]MDK8182145.1 helix-turn-helix transcriptional regulator [Paenibacillus sp. UMB4589-SE434]
MAFTQGRCLLKQRLKEAKMKQVVLAQKTGYSAQTISNYANNRSKMSAEVMKTIAVAIDCSMEDLYEWEMVRRRK